MVTKFLELNKMINRQHHRKVVQLMYLHVVTSFENGHMLEADQQKSKLVLLLIEICCFSFEGILSKTGRSEASNKITEYFKVFCIINVL